MTASVSSVRLDYFYGNQSDQFVFYRVPKALFTEKRYHGLSAESKLLYGLMLDRMGISARNQWMDLEGRVYIYFTMDHAMELLDIGHNKAVKLFQELERGGLILRKKQGQGKPALVYVMNFIPPQNPDQYPDQSTPPVPSAGPKAPETDSGSAREDACVMEQPGYEEQICFEEPILVVEQASVEEQRPAEEPILVVEQASVEEERPVEEPVLVVEQASVEEQRHVEEPILVVEQTEVEEQVLVQTRTADDQPDTVLTTDAPSEQDRDRYADQTSENRQSEPADTPEAGETGGNAAVTVAALAAGSVEPCPVSLATGACHALPDFPPVLPQEVQTSGNRKSAFPLFGSLDIPKSEANKNKMNNTDSSNTESSIYPPAPALTGRQTARWRNAERMRRMEECRERIRDNIDYHVLAVEHPMDMEQIDGYVELMAEVMTSNRASWRINQSDIPTEQVAERFDALNRDHILYVKECLDNTTTQIANVRAYTLTTLYNAPTTMRQYYASRVSHDMARDRRERERLDAERERDECIRKCVRELHESRIRSHESAARTGRSVSARMGV